MAGIYIHIPFCMSRCIYCGFYSTTLTEWRERYVDALCREMELRRDFFPSTPLTGEQGGGLLTTIYLGGGTPSMLTPEQLHKLFAHIDKVWSVKEGANAHIDKVWSMEERANAHIDKLWSVEEGARSMECVSQFTREITMECNPDDLTAEYVAALSQLPINRISMGAQTFSDERLRFLHRRHSAADVTAAVSRLRAVGFNNISIDLMFGFPGETLEEWQADIDQALALDVEHISAYSLMYEEGTKLYKMRGESREVRGVRVEPLDEETERRMYETLIDRLTAASYEQYEISNFAKRVEVRGARCEVRGEEQAVSGEKRESYRALHNSSYWHDEPYLGIGAAAHSYYKPPCPPEGETKERESERARGRRYRSWNISDIHQYIESIERGIIPSEQEDIDDDTHYNDLVTTALRTREGIILSVIEPKYRDYLMKNAQQSLHNGLLSIDNDHIHLTRRGLFVSDDVMSDLIYV